MENFLNLQNCPDHEVIMDFYAPMSVFTERTHGCLWYARMCVCMCVCVKGAFSTPVAGMASAVKHPQSQVPHTPTQCFIFVPILFNKTFLHVLLGCLFFFSIPIVFRFEPDNLKPHTQKSHPECSVLYNHSTDKKNSINNKCSVSHILCLDQPTGQRHRTCCLGNSLLK